MDWNKSAEGQALLSEGYHKLKVTKVARFKKDRQEYLSNDGIPQILCVVESESGESGVMMFTLSKKAEWTLARFLKHAGADLDRMTHSGVELEHFQNEDFAIKQLDGRICWACVTHKTATSGKVYPQIEPVAESEVPAGNFVGAGVQTSPNTTLPPASDPHAPIGPDDIPF